MARDTAGGCGDGPGLITFRGELRDMALSLAKGGRLPEGQRGWEGTYPSVLSPILPEGLSLTPTCSVPDLP